MTFTTSRFAARAAAALLAATSLAGLASAPAIAAEAAPITGSMAAVEAPAAGMAEAPAVGGPAAPAAGSPTAPSSVDSDQGPITRGTALELRNFSNQTVWLREYYGAGRWDGARALAPGAHAHFVGDAGGSDDIELRLFNNQADARANRNHLDVDAENPIYSKPWLSLGYSSKYFSEGEGHTWKRDDGTAEFFGYRHDDTPYYKSFELTIKRMF